MYSKAVSTERLINMINNLMEILKNIIDIQREKRTSLNIL